MIDSAERFTATAQRYQRYRPSYPVEMVEWILSVAELARPARVADIGCGTGISTRLLAGLGLEVVGVDPNQAMLAQARDAGGARYVCGLAGASGLASGSVRLVTAGQAFHWFDIGEAHSEFRRILAPPRWCAVFWNLRGVNPLLDAYDKLLRRHSAEYSVLRKPAQTQRAIRADLSVRDLQEAEFSHTQLLDAGGLHGRAHSSSYVVHGIDEMEAFDQALGELFAEHQENGQVCFQYRTVVACWRLV